MNLETIELKQTPTRDKKGGLLVAFRVSKEWLKENKYIRPVAKTDIYKGQCIYKLPKTIRKKSIYFCYPQLTK